MVSIHAPTRGATSIMLDLELTEAVVSIHAPTRGATYQTYPEILDNIVSIHAPTRGAT